MYKAYQQQSSHTDSQCEIQVGERSYQNKGEKCTLGKIQNAALCLTHDNMLALETPPYDLYKPRHALSAQKCRLNRMQLMWRG